MSEYWNEILARGIEDSIAQHRLKYTLRLVKKADINSNKKVLDMGGGHGYLKNFFHDYTLLNHPFDSHSYTYEILQDLNTEPNLKFEDKNFDIIFACEFFEHLFCPDKIVKEIVRVLKDDGYVIVTLPNEDVLSERLRYLIRGPLYQEYKDFEKQSCSYHHWNFTLEKAICFVSKYFEIEEILYDFPSIPKGKIFPLKFRELLARKFPKYFCGSIAIRAVKKH